MITHKYGFGILELLLVIAIMALLSSIVAPQFTKLLPKYEQHQFINRLENLVQSALIRAAKEHVFYAITFDLEQNLISLDVWDKASKKRVPMVHTSPLTKPCAIPKHIEIKQLFVEGFDEIGKYMGNKKAAKIWFYISPEYQAQSVIINMVNITNPDTPQQISLVLPPLAQGFHVYETFQTP